MQKLQELFLAELGDIYNAEKQLIKALPRMAKAAQSPELRSAIEAHLQETQQQVERLDRVFQMFNKPAKGRKCKAMEGLVAEGQEVMSDFKGEPSLDAAMIAAAQKVEHYEIASYGTLCTWAELLGNRDALRLLKETMSEEVDTDKKLTALAESSINLEASEEEGAMKRASRPGMGGKRATTLKMASRRR